MPETSDGLATEIPAGRMPETPAGLAAEAPDRSATETPDPADEMTESPAAVQPSSAAGSSHAQLNAPAGQASTQVPQPAQRWMVSGLWQYRQF